MIKILDSISFAAKLILLVLPVAIVLIGLLSWIAYIGSVGREIDERIGILNGLSGDIMMTAVISTQYASAVENRISDTVQTKGTEIKETLSRIQSQKSWIEKNIPKLYGSINDIIDQNQVIIAITSSGEDITDESGLLSDMAQEAYKEITGRSLELKQEKEQLNDQFGMTEMVIIVLVVIVFVGVLVFSIANRITTPINLAVRAMQDIAEGEGDLTQRLSVESKDELGKLASGFNTFIGKMQELVLQIRNTMSNIDTASDEIVIGSNNLSDRTNDQTTVLHETSASIAEISGAVSQNAVSSREAKDLAINAQTEAQKGGEIIGRAVAAMQQVDESSSKMANIIDTINGIAFQTNILALNAAVEAARAGDQGRGFAVVASEVRDLSHRSAVAAEEIKQLVTNNIEKISSGSALVNESGEILAEIVDSTDKVSQIILNISDASQEQADGIEEINRAILRMEDVTQQNAALVEEFTATTESTRRQVSALSQLLKTYKVEEGDYDLLPSSRSTLNLVKSVPRGEDGHEEAIYR